MPNRADCKTTVGEFFSSLMNHMPFVSQGGEFMSSKDQGSSRVRDFERLQESAREFKSSRQEGERVESSRVQVQESESSRGGESSRV